MDDRDDDQDEPFVLQYLVSVPVPEGVDDETVSAIESALVAAVWDKAGGAIDRAEPFMAPNPTRSVVRYGELRRATRIG